MIEWSMSMFSGGNIEAMVSLEPVFATLFFSCGNSTLFLLVFFSLMAFHAYLATIYRLYSKFKLTRNAF